MAGRGSFIESFPLFGYDLAALRRALRREARAAARAARLGARHLGGPAPGAPRTTSRVYPRPLQEKLPVWIAVGGNAESAIRAGALGLPMALAIIGGMPERFAPFAELHREGGAAGRARPGDAAARHQLPRLRRGQLPAGRGRALPGLRRDDEQDRPRARLVAAHPAGLRGGPRRCAARSSSAARSRWSRRSSSSTRSSATSASSPRSASARCRTRNVMRAIELLGTEVAPVVRKEVAGRVAAA